MRTIRASAVGAIFGTLTGFLSDLYLAPTLPSDSWRPVTSLMIGFFSGVTASVAFGIVASFSQSRKPAWWAVGIAWMLGLFIGENFVGIDGVKHLFVPAIFGMIAALCVGRTIPPIALSRRTSLTSKGTATEIKKESVIVARTASQSLFKPAGGIAVVIALAVAAALLSTYLNQRGSQFDPFSLIILPIHALSAGMCSLIILTSFKSRQRVDVTSLTIGTGWFAGAVLGELSREVSAFGAAGLLFTPFFYPFLIGPICVLASSLILASLSRENR